MRSASSRQAILPAALLYATRGWPVLPLVAREKRPLTKRGLLDATTDKDAITLWWQRWPDANVGLRTGVAFDVLDIDGEIGNASLLGLAGPEAATASGPVSHTGRGTHWLYLPGGTANRAAIRPKLDWRGTNGYIVAPPSIHPDGHQYRWDPEQGEDTPLQHPPKWLTPHLAEWHEPGTAHPVQIVKANPYDPHALAHVSNPKRLRALQTDIVGAARKMGLNPRPRGARFVLNCIFHEGDREASLTLYPPDNSFYCYGCGAWGDVINLQYRRPGGRRD